MSEDRYRKFANDLWEKGVTATDSGVTRVVTKKQFQNALERHDLTEFQATHPHFDERRKVSITRGGIVMILDTALQYQEDFSSGLLDRQQDNA